MTIEERLQADIDRAARSQAAGGVVVRVERSDGSFAWTGSAGELGPEVPFFIASTTKLYTTAMVLRLVERSRLALDDRLVDRVDPALVARLHVYRGIDETGRITLRHLLAHTSGLPDYFLGKGPDGHSLERTLRGGADVGWGLEDVLQIARELGPAFRPGTPGKARYSDTNFQLLGRVIEEATGATYADALRSEVLGPLGLEHTWLFTDPADPRPLSLRDGPRPLVIPNAMASFGPDGGIVAPVDDLMRFLRAFFEGGLFGAALLEGLKTYNRIFFPLQYGVGFARIKLPRILSPFRGQPELVGHSGLSGAFAFSAPGPGVYLAGTVNNLARPDRSFRLMLGLLATMRSERLGSANDHRRRGRAVRLWPG